MSMYTPTVHGSLKDVQSDGFYVDGDKEEGVIFTLPYGQIRFTPEDALRLAAEIKAFAEREPE